MMSLLHKVRKKKSEQKGEKADKPKVQLSDKINDQESTAFLEAGMEIRNNFALSIFNDILIRCY